MITALIPAYNEGETIFRVVKETEEYVDEILVIDDNSTDDTKKRAEEAGARVLSNKKNQGYIFSIKKGFRKAKGNVVVTLDADGEHNPKEIPRIVKPIQEGEVDLVLGKRKKIERLSERFLNWVVNFKVKVEDSGTGFRAIRKDLAQKLELKGKCTCGVLLLESFRKGASFREVSVKNRTIEKERRVAWSHFWQFFYLLSELLKA